MNDNADAKKLGQAVENLASKIVEIIGSRLRQFAEGGELHQPGRMAGQNTGSEGRVDQKTVAEHLHISRRTLYQWMQRGKIPYMRIGNRPRFILRDVDEVLNAATRFGRDTKPCDEWRTPLATTPVSGSG